MSTSRVGRKPVTIPSGVNVQYSDGNLAIKGPKGHTNIAINTNLEVVIEEGKIKVQARKDRGYRRSGTGSRLVKAIPGTTRAEISNAVYGVTHGFERKLVLVGVGYRAQAKGKILSLSLGFSHPVDFPVPTGITIETPSVTEITVKGMDKHLVGHVASKIRELRPPEPYKGKGIRYADEVIIRKETKKK